MSIARFLASSKKNPCPVCGRTKDGDCRASEEIVYCHTHRNTDMAVGETLTGCDGQDWAMVGVSEEAQGFAMFKVHQERAQKEQAVRKRGRPPKPEPEVVGPQKTPRPDAEFEHWYRGRDGGHHCFVRRYSGGRKTCQWRSPVGCPETELLPYRWDDVLGHGGDRVYLTEGELDCDRLWEIGLPAVSVRSWGDWHPALFADAGRTIVVIPDSDRTGISKAHKSAEILTGAGVRVEICQLPHQGVDWGNPPSKNGLGVYDWLESGGSVSALQETLEFLPSHKQGPAEETSIPLEVFRALYKSGNGVCTINESIHLWNGSHYEKSSDVVELRRIGDWMQQFYPKSATARRCSEALAWLKIMTGVEPSTVNPSGYLNLRNGTLWLDWQIDGVRWQLLPHSKERIFTYCGAYDYRPGAESEHCDRLLSALEPGEQEIFLRTIAASIDLAEIRRRRGRAVKALLLWGAGANGKDTLRDAVSQLFGGQGMSGCTLQDFSQYDNGRKFPLSPLEWSRVNWASENFGRLNLDKLESLKAVITGDPISIELKGQNEYLMAPKSVMLFNVNSAPNITAGGTAIQTRFAILKFNKTFVAGANPALGQIEADPRMKESPEWRAENVLPALLNRVLISLDALVREGINYEPTKGSLEEVRESNRHLLRFCRDVELVEDPSSVLRVSEIWEMLEDWYREEGYLDDSTGRRIWAEDPAPGDALCRQAQGIQRAFSGLFARARWGFEPRPGGGKKIPVVIGLGFAGRMAQPAPEPRPQAPTPEPRELPVEPVAVDNVVVPFQESQEEPGQLNKGFADDFPLPETWQDFEPKAGSRVLIFSARLALQRYRNIPVSDTWTITSVHGDVVEITNKDNRTYRVHRTWIAPLD